MRTALFVFAFVLILFGISIWYYRSDPEGGFSLPKIQSPFGKAQPTKTPDKSATLGDSTEKVKSLEIVDGSSGKIIVGRKAVYFAVAKTESGGSVSVNGNWYLSDNKVGVLESSQGVETTLKTSGEGKAKLMLSYQNLKTEKDLEVFGSVLGSTVSVSPTPKPTSSPTKPVVIPTAAPTSAPVQPNVVAVNIYDLDGRRIAVGDTRNFLAKVLFSNGAEKDLPVNWSITNNLGTLSRSSGTNTDFKALRSANGELVASYQNVTSKLSIQVY